MTDLKKVPEVENKKNFKNKNLFKRFKVNLEDFEIEKSDSDEKLPDNEYNRDFDDLDGYNKNLDDQEGVIGEFEGNNDFVFSDDQEGVIGEFEGNNDFVFSDDQEEMIDKFNEDLILIDNDNKKNFKDNHDNSDKELLSSEENEIVDSEENEIVDSEENEIVDSEENEIVDSEENEIVDSEENEIVDEKLPLFSKIKETAYKYSKRKFRTLPILGLAIGIFFIITGVLIFLGNSDKIVDNVVSGETTTLSVLITFIGIIFFIFSLLKIFSPKKAFGNTFHMIKDFESEIDETNKNDEINPKFQEEDLIIKEVDINSFDDDDSKSEDM